MLRAAIILVICILSFSGQTQTNITYSVNSSGGVSFSLFGGVLPLNTTISSIVWNFDDGTVVSGGTNLNAFHQYPYNNASYNVEVQYVKNVSGTITNETEIETIAFTQWTSPMTCPVAIFNFQETDWCGSGELTLNWTYCDEGLDWTADYVAWNMGDGQTVITQGNLAVVHTYQSNMMAVITAQAYFVGPNGETCSTTIRNISAGGTNPCLLSGGNPVASEPFLEIETYFASPELFINAGDYCQTTAINFFDAGGALPAGNNLGWSYEVFVDGTSITTGSSLPSNSGSFFQATLPSGDHLIELVYLYNYNDKSCFVSDGLVVSVDSCTRDCDNCNAFEPEPGERYWISAWVKETHSNQVKTYSDAFVKLTFTGGTTQSFDFFPSGDIVEGWQRIVGSFTIPTGTTGLDLKLGNNGTTDAFFDDIRFHPFNGSFKSYVYDSETLWLTAELDDNNYATFYEYDQEGQLIRIKKETARGIMTIQESSSSNPKSE